MRLRSRDDSQAPAGFRGDRGRTFTASERDAYDQAATWETSPQRWRRYVIEGRHADPDRLAWLPVRHDTASLPGTAAPAARLRARSFSSVYASSAFCSHFSGRSEVARLGIGGGQRVELVEGFPAAQLAGAAWPIRRPACRRGVWGRSRWPRSGGASCRPARTRARGESPRCIRRWPWRSPP